MSAVLCRVLSGALLASTALAAAPAPSKPVANPWPGNVSLPPFPKPDPAGAFGELKIVQPDGSPIRQAREDWDGARQRVKADATWTAWLRERQRETDAWIAQRHDRVEWVAGWWHDFVSPKDGSFLTFTPDEPGAETLSSPSDPHVKLTPKLHGAWVYVFRTQHSDMMVEAARLYRVTGERRYAEWAAAQLDFYAANYPRWPKRPESQLMWQSLDEAVILTKFVTAARTLGDFVAPERKQRWVDNLIVPMARLLERSHQFIHNISTWHRAAEGMAALYAGRPDLWATAIDGRYGLRAQIRQGITSDYLWFEQSLHYNEYVTTGLRPFFAYAQLSGHGGEFRTEMEMVENLLLSPLYLRFPNDQLPNPADGAAPRKVPNRLFFAECAQLFPTAIGLAEAQRQRTWEALADPLPAPAKAAALPPVVSRNLESSRMAVLRRGDWQVYFHYGQLTGSHAQAEALNYELFYQTVDLSHDPGSVGYGSGMINDYYRAGVCANVPLIDGEGQKVGWKRDSWDPGELIDYAPDRVAARQPRYRPDAQAERRLELRDDAFRDVVSIQTTDGREHALGFLLNLTGKVELPREAAVSTKGVALPPAAGFKYWTDVRELLTRDRLVVQVVAGGRRFPVTLTLPGDFRVLIASAPDYPPRRRTALYVEVRGTAAELKTDFGAPTGAE